MIYPLLVYLGLMLVAGGVAAAMRYVHIFTTALFLFTPPALLYLLGLGIYHLVHC